MRLAEARARRSVLLRDSSFISTDAKGSSDSYKRALNTTSRPQVGLQVGTGGCNLLAPLRKLTTSTCLTIDSPPSGEWKEPFHKHSPFQSIQTPRRVCLAHENVGRSAPLISPKQPDMKAPQLQVQVPHQTAHLRLQILPGRVRPGRRHQKICQVQGPRLVQPVRGIDYHRSTLLPWSCITPVAIYWLEETHTAWLLASAMSAHPPSAGSETGRRTAGNVHSRSWRPDPPRLSCSGSKSSKPTRGATRGATSTLLEESPSSKACPPCGSRDWGCALLWWRESESPPIAGDSIHACTELWFVRLRGDLCKKPQTCCRCESVHAAVPAMAENALELTTLLPAPSGLCATGSEVLTIVTKPVCPWILLPRLDHDTWRHLCPTASELWCCCGRPRCANGPKSTLSKGFEISAKTAAGACVVNCQVWKGALKTKWWPSAAERGEWASPLLLVKAHSQIRYRGKNALIPIHTQPQELMKLSALWLAGVSRDWAKISHSSK